MTLTNHYPFNLDEKDATIAKATTGDKTVDNYFQTARYLDESLEQFFKDLKNQVCIKTQSFYYMVTITVFLRTITVQ